jgi:hypothetical protein
LVFKNCQTHKVDGMGQSAFNAIGLSGPRQTAPKTCARTIRPPHHRYNANHYDFDRAADHYSRDNRAANNNLATADHYSRDNSAADNRRALTHARRLPRRPQQPPRPNSRPPKVN